MTKEDKKLLTLCLEGLKDKSMKEIDYTNYLKGALTFRELLASIKNPKGELKAAMQSYYAGSVYRRVFKS